MSMSLVQRIAQLRTPVRSLLLLYFINTFTGNLTGVFVQIQVFQIFPDLVTNIAGAMFSFTGAMVGFFFFFWLYCEPLFA
jgi:hypothetical protein